MSTAANLRRQVELALAGRIPAALSFRPPVLPELLSCGLAEVDSMLSGGLPVGAITELTGAHSSGRTTLVLSALAGVTQSGESCAYVDISDALDPASTAALGVDLRRLLWVRTGAACAGAADVAAGSPFPSAIPVPALADKAQHGIGWCHPRNEVIGLPKAVGALFTPSPQAQQVDFTPRCSESVRRERVRPVLFAPLPIAQQPTVQCSRTPRKKQTAWTRLDNALRATDLLLNTGGFRAIVLDMAEVPPEQARRVPLATWYRFRLQAEKSRTLFLLMTSVPCANSCAAVSLHCQQDEIDWQQAALGSARLLAGLHYRVSVDRNRTVAPMRKMPSTCREAAWSGRTTWSR